MHSRKVEFCRLLSKHYNIPIIRVEDVFEFIDKNPNLDPELYKDLCEERAKLYDRLATNQYVESADDRIILGMKPRRS